MTEQPNPQHTGCQMTQPIITSRYTDALHKALDIIGNVNDEYILPNGSKNWEVERALDRCVDLIKKEIGHEVGLN